MIGDTRLHLAAWSLNQRTGKKAIPPAVNHAGEWSYRSADGRGGTRIGHALASPAHSDHARLSVGIPRGA